MSPTTSSATGDSRWHDLDPLTRLVVSVGTVIAAALLGGIVCLALLAVAAVLLPAVLAHSLREVLRTSLLLALPLAVSVIIVNVLFAPGTTAQGLALATEVVLRVLTMAGAVVLFYSTTRPAELVASLQHHGTSARLTFVIHNGVAMILPKAAKTTASRRAKMGACSRNWIMAVSLRFVARRRRWTGRPAYPQG